LKRRENRIRHGHPYTIAALSRYSHFTALQKDKTMLTPTQQKMLAFIQTFTKRHHYSPSLREIAEALELSPTSKSLISRYIQQLEKMGYIERPTGRYRTIHLKKIKTNTTSPFVIPFLGKIAAGSPIEAVQQQEEIDITDLFITQHKTQDLFALQVKGDSMIDEGILDGDTIICEKTSTAYHGAIVIALIDNYEATLKRIHFIYEGDTKMIKLIPANPNLKPQVYPTSRITIQGIYKGLLRLPPRAG